MCRCLERDVPTLGWLGHLCCCCVRAPQAVVTVHLDSAKYLAKQDIVGVGEQLQPCPHMHRSSSLRRA